MSTKHNDVNQGEKDGEGKGTYDAQTTGSWLWVPKAAEGFRIRPCRVIGGMWAGVRERVIASAEELG